MNYFVILTLVLWQRVVLLCVRESYDCNSLNVINYNFSTEQYMLPEDDRVVETCRSVLNVVM